MTSNQGEFKTLMNQLKALKVRHHASSDCWQQIVETSERAAQIYNDEATRVAKKHGVRPRLISAAGLRR